MEAGVAEGAVLEQHSPSQQSYASGSHQSKPRTQVSGHSTSGCSIIAGLTELQTAMLEERMKRLELAELQMVEESLAEDQYQLLDARTREGLCKREELLREQERQRHQIDNEARAAHTMRESQRGDGTGETFPNCSLP